MKIKVLLPLALLFLLLCLCAAPAFAEAWPASREELAAENIMAWRNEGIAAGEYRSAPELLAEIWAQKNYGEGALIHSIEPVYSETEMWMDVSRLLEGYQTLLSSVWEVQLVPEVLPEGIASPGKVITVSVQLLYLTQDTSFFDSPITLIGCLSPEKTFRDLSELWAYVREDPRFADLPAQLRTKVPEGVREIDLRTVLGEDALGVYNAWMLNADTCVLSWSSQNYEEEELEEEELIVLNLRDCSILSRTPLPPTSFFVEQRFEEDGTFFLLFEPESVDGFYSFDYYYTHDPENTYIKVIVAPDGTVTFDGASSKLTLMPGGKTGIREGYHGSLYSVDMATGEEELLIQGTAEPYGPMSYEAYLKYVPFWDDEGFYELDEDGNVVSLPHPMEEEDEEYSPWRTYHGFSMYQPLDEYRFVYKGYGWEWGTGFGVYDLRTHTDHRITGRGEFFGMEDGTLFGSLVTADVNTYEISPLSEPMQEQFDLVYQSWWGGSVADYDISADGTRLALLDTQPTLSDLNPGANHTLAIVDIRSGEVGKTIDIANPFAREGRVSFYDDTRLMLFYAPKKGGCSTYLYLVDLAQVS